MASARTNPLFFFGKEVKLARWDALKLFKRIFFLLGQLVKLVGLD
jgi:hypothetical protein